jgi:hypothetical protein
MDVSIYGKLLGWYDNTVQGQVVAGGNSHKVAVHAVVISTKYSHCGYWFQ